MSSPKSYHHGNLRNELLAEAARVLEQSGPEAITLRGLARALDVSHAAPAHHFTDRAALLGELAADGYAALADALEAALESEGRPVGAARVGAAYVRFGITHPQRYKLMFASQLLTQDCPERLDAESSRAYAMLLDAVYGRGRHPTIGGEYRIGAPELATWSVVHGLVMLWIDGQLGSADVDETELTRLSDEIVATFCSVLPSTTDPSGL